MVKHYNNHVRLLLEDPLLGTGTVEGQNEIINSLVGHLLQRFNDSETFAWDVILKICKYAMNLMEVANKYYCIGEVVYHWLISDLSWTLLFRDFSL